jgi:hypothetical protein
VANERAVRVELAGGSRRVFGGVGSVETSEQEGEMKRVLIGAVRINGRWRGRINRHLLAEMIAVHEAVALRQRLTDEEIEALFREIHNEH